MGRSSATGRPTDSALGQLEWMVGYLYKIHKPQIARGLDRNRKQIVEDIRGRG